MRRPRTRLVTSHSGGVGAPPGWPLRAACQELADDPGKSGRKRGPTPEEERRGGAPRGAPASVIRRRSRPQTGSARTARRGHGVRRSAPAPFGASPPSLSRGAGREGLARRPPKKFRAAGRRSIGSMMRFFAATHSAVILRCEGAIAPSLEGWQRIPALVAILRGALRAHLRMTLCQAAVTAPSPRAAGRGLSGPLRGARVIGPLRGPARFNRLPPRPISSTAPVPRPGNDRRQGSRRRAWCVRGCPAAPCQASGRWRGMQSH